MKLEIVLRVGEHEAVIRMRGELPTAKELAEMPATFGIPPEVDLTYAIASEVALYMVDYKGEIALQEKLKDGYMVNHPPSDRLKQAVIEVLARSNEEFRRRVTDDGREQERDAGRG